jgi:predicted dehydrogenase
MLGVNMNKAGFADDGRLNVALVGLGWWGKVIGGDLRKSLKVRVAKAVDTAPAAGEWAQAQGFEFTTNYEEALADPSIGAVILCTPHTLHAGQIIAAANAKKNVICEKPLTMTRCEAVAAVTACEANNVLLGVGHEHRFKPAMIELLRAVRAGDLGTIQMVEATLTNPGKALAADNWRVQKKERPAGSMTALGIHGLDMCVAICGEAKNVLARSKSLVTPLEDTLGILVDFKSGANAVITSITGPPFSIRFAVFGNKGWMELHDKTFPQAPQGWTLTRAKHGGGIAEATEYPAMSMVRANAEAFADAVAGRAPYPVTYQEMIATIAAFEAISKSAESGQIVSVAG